MDYSVTRSLVSISKAHSPFVLLMLTPLKSEPLFQCFSFPFNYRPSVERANLSDFIINNYYYLPNQKFLRYGNYRKQMQICKITLSFCYKMSIRICQVFHNNKAMSTKKQIFFQEEEIDESPISSADSEYVSHLKSQCVIRFNALKTAESLISAYQKENQILKNENQTLKEQMQKYETQSQNISLLYNQIQSLEATLLKYSQRINELLEAEMSKDRRIASLQKSLNFFEQRQNKLQIQADRKRKKEMESKRKIGVQKFNNYFKFAAGSDSFCSMSHSLQKQSIQILQQQVRKKDEEIIKLLRRLRDVEEQLKMGSRKERLKTSDTFINNSLRRNTYSSIEE